MPTTVIYPKVSLEASSGRIARWRVAEGEAVTAGQILFEIDNDKAAVEVEAPAAGIIEALAAEGDEIEVGAGVALIREPGEAAAPAGSPREVSTLPAASAVTTAAGPSTAAPDGSPGRTRRGPNPTPLARRIARDHGLMLEGLAGSGPRGRVRSSDVLALLDRPVPAAPPAMANAAPAGSPSRLNAQWLRRGDGLPVILLHGFAADLNAWRGFLAGGSARWPVLALDLPGHGRSSRATPADLDAMAASVEATIAAEVSGGAVLVGHSLGGAVAARIAARARVDVRSLGLLAPAGLGPQIDGAFLAGILRARDPASLRPWLDWLVHDPAVVSDAFVQTVAEQRRDADLTRAMQAVADRLFADGTQCISIRDDLARLRIPTRVVFGRQDRVLPFEATRSLPGHVALHALDACGHMPHLEHPDLCARILDELRRCA